MPYQLSSRKPPEITVPLACSVRGCAAPLALADDATLRCPRGHSFDRARQGYWNLLQPQDRRSLAAGDSAAAVEARGRWLARGLADGLTAAVGEVVPAGRLVGGAIVTDLGCGDGFFGRRLFERREVAFCGIDLSVHALRAAARAWPDATWVAANADRRLPLLDGSVDLALSLFGRRPTGDAARVLRAGGALVVALPGADDLAELRQVALERVELRDRVPGVVEALGERFRLVERRAWRVRAHLDRLAIEDALVMTYRGARTSERARVAGLGDLEVTLSAEILSFERVTDAASAP